MNAIKLSLWKRRKFCRRPLGNQALSKTTFNWFKCPKKADNALETKSVPAELSNHFQGCFGSQTRQFSIVTENIEFFLREFFIKNVTNIIP